MKRYPKGATWQFAFPFAKTEKDQLAFIFAKRGNSKPFYRATIKSDFRIFKGPQNREAKNQMSRRKITVSHCNIASYCKFRIGQERQTGLSECNQRTRLKGGNPRENRYPHNAQTKHKHAYNFPFSLDSSCDLTGWGGCDCVCWGHARTLDRPVRCRVKRATAA